MFGMRVRGGLLAALIMFAVPVAATLAAMLVSSPAAAQTAASIVVEGNRRVEVETIRSYFGPAPAAAWTRHQIDDGLKALIETGLFQDVRINQAGGRLVVTVVENPVISRIAFEGNKKVKDEQLSAEIQSKPRGTLSRPMVQSDAQRIVEIYRRSGRYDVRVTPKSSSSRTTASIWCSRSTRAPRPASSRSSSSATSPIRPIACKDIIKTREANLLSFLGGNDVYDPDRVEADRDLIRRFYLKNGYADVQVVAALTEYDPEKKGFLVTFKIEEGQQYRVAPVDFQSSIAHARRQRAAQLLARQCRLALQRRGAGEIGRGNADRGLAARLRLRDGASARRPQFRGAHRFDRLRRRRGPAHLYRAHQRPRQHPHPRLRDPPRVRSVRRRCLQPRAGRSRRAAPEEPRLLQEREDLDRARLLQRSRHPDRRSRREIDRRLLGLGRLLDHRRRARRSQHLRAQLARPRPVSPRRR